MKRILRAFSLDSVLVFLRGFIPVPPNGTPDTPDNYPPAATMPQDERLRNFPEIIAFYVEHISGRGKKL